MKNGLNEILINIEAFSADKRFLDGIFKKTSCIFAKIWYTVAIIMEAIMNTIYNTPCGGVGTGLNTLRQSDTVKALKDNPAIARVFAYTVLFKCKEAYNKLLTHVEKIDNTAVDRVLPYRKLSRCIRGYDDGVP